jgi:hypothetical protein
LPGFTSVATLASAVAATLIAIAATAAAAPCCARLTASPFDSDRDFLTADTAATADQRRRHV